MPVVTQTRPYPQPIYASQHWIGGVKRRTEGIQAPQGTQTTTSFRTRKSDSEPLVDSVLEASAHGNSTSRVDFQRALRSEYVSRYDIGHDFSTEHKKTVFINDSVDMTRTLGTTDYRFRGVVIPNYFGFNVHYQQYPFPTTAEITADGNRGYGMAAPTQPEAGLAQVLAEIKERIPSITGALIRRNGLNSKSIGDEYLNVQFGVKPLIRDIEKLAMSVLDASRIVKQYQKDSGNVVRRSRLLQDDARVLDRGIWPAEAIRMPTREGLDVKEFFIDLSGAKLHYLYSTRNVVKFAGAFSYHLAEADAFLGRVERFEQLANHLLGTRLTADLVYELTPWSWLIDWQVQLGSFFKNVTVLHSDGLVMRYGYVMHDQNMQCTFTSTGLRPVDNTRDVPSAVTMVSDFRRKTRVRATPYGFGLNPSGFSAGKWAILGALGMSKGPNLSLR